MECSTGNHAHIPPDPNHFSNQRVMTDEYQKRKIVTDNLKYKNSVSTNKNRNGKWCWVPGIGEGSGSKNSSLWDKWDPKVPHGRPAPGPLVVASGGEGLPNSGKERKNKNNTNKTQLVDFLPGVVAFLGEAGWKNKTSLIGAETLTWLEKLEWEGSDKETETERPKTNFSLNIKRKLIYCVRSQDDSYLCGGSD